MPHACRLRASPSAWGGHHITALFAFPPAYSVAGRANELSYINTDCMTKNVNELSYGN